MSARDRIRQVVEKWFLVEPLLFAVWTTHEVVVNPRIGTMRVERGRVEYNPAFVDALNRRDLEQVLVVEAMRMLLKHPYSRRPPSAELAYAASNVTLQEYLQTTLPLPRAHDLFGCHDFDRQYYEFYCHKLAEKNAGSTALLARRASEGEGEGDASAGDASDRHSSIDAAGTASGAETISAYVDPDRSGQDNAAAWAPDELRGEQINERIRTAAENQTWGTIPGSCKERILATLRPRLNYRAVLRHFRASILSIRRRLTRMKPNRRYGFQYMGSRYDFTTRLLVAVDVSGSMSSADIAHGFSVINRFFKYGIPAIDVIQFDTELQGTGEPTSLKRARHVIDVTGRGGTSFDPVIAFLDLHPEYDGAVIFTDGIAPVPPRPRNRRTRVLWLFNHEENYRQQYRNLRAIGPAAYLKVARGSETSSRPARR